MRNLDSTLILRLLREEHLMKIGESDSFAIKGGWELTLRKEEAKYAPYAYSITGHKTGTNETISRRFTSMQGALLHCINRFNENAIEQNRYKTLEDAILKNIAFLCIKR